MGARAVVLLSGGLDSATVAAIALAQGRTLTALSFDYGQRHRYELEAAREVASALGILDHRVVQLGLSSIGGSALTADLPVPKDALGQAGIPVTYVPARNTVFLSVGLGLCEVVGAFELYFGANALDYSGYPDCRPEFIAAFEAMANLATKVGVEGNRLRIHAPLIELSKAQIVQLGTSLGVDYGLTVSCYKATDDGLACGQCDACRLRSAGFAAAGLADPTPYIRLADTPHDVQTR